MPQLSDFHDVYGNFFFVTKWLFAFLSLHFQQQISYIYYFLPKLTTFAVETKIKCRTVTEELHQ